MYKKGDTTPSGQPLPYFKVNELINDLIVSSDYVNRLNEVNDFNKKNRWKKKGISMTPIKYFLSVFLPSKKHKISFIIFLIFRWGVSWTGTI